MTFPLRVLIDNTNAPRCHYNTDRPCPSYCHLGKLSELQLDPWHKSPTRTPPPACSQRKAPAQPLPRAILLDRLADIQLSLGCVAQAEHLSFQAEKLRGAAQ